MLEEVGVKQSCVVSGAKSSHLSDVTNGAMNNSDLDVMDSDGMQFALTPCQPCHCFLMQQRKDPIYKISSKNSM